ncbi:succinyl-diaminopimelate desuccinylase [Desulfonispora thiosulfatigenes DSM 11270]|uniref:Succinyl-diaminopimelate desuccinylase n=1 Tax=Desulfonispora thiosulfatigenes DSM 11270 TaxID=656914 RepID=A0A1W1UUX2_DESTI|nr:dipeptidase PepV [Desulfonispora thiosulfatigenes]SMB84882.1 succinyl-diaminopimelate desuccinylase [Desulfonispora thiosulfatigenes DSM 11270]
MQFTETVEKYQEEMIKSTKELINIRSVEESPRENMPFGEGVDQALKYVLNLGQELGFKVENIDNYAGHIDYGAGEEIIGVLVHLDVVPEGDGWTYPPYGSVVENGKIYGRGAIDNKGPAIASLYAMKALKDSGLSIKKKIRIILGTNEETNWKGIDYYLKKVKAPDMAFVPDANFPVIQGEKGILIFDLEKKLAQKEGSRLKIKGGNAPNMVPDSCEASIQLSKSDQEVYQKRLSEVKEAKIEFKENELIIKTTGISAHGSTPEAGLNAISLMMTVLGELPLEGEAKEFVDLYNGKIGMGYHGENIGCALQDEVSGKLVFNVGMIDLDESKVKLTVNIRYPISYDSKRVYTGIQEKLKGTGLEITPLEEKLPIYLPEDHELVQKLMAVYREQTRDMESKPLVIGGGTYARALKNAVAFGALFMGEEEVAHQKDEYIKIETLTKCAKIYAHAMYELAK